MRETCWSGRQRTTSAAATEGRFDACVVGGGIAGLSVAYELVRGGARVALVEAQRAGAGESGRSSAHVTAMLDEPYVALERTHGRDVVAHVWQSQRLALERLRTLVAQERIDCGLKDVSAYRLSADVAALEAERDLLTQLGADGVTFVGDVFVGGRSRGPGLQVAGQAMIDPRAFTEGLANAVDRLGVRVLEGERVRRVSGRGPFTVDTEGGRSIMADAVVLATHVPIRDRVMVHASLTPMRTYVVGLALAEPLPPLLLWDSEQPYHYVRTVEHGRGASSLLVGGEDRPVGSAEDTEERFRALEAWARARFDVGETRFRWSGQVQETGDGLALIGRNPLDADRMYIATGFAGNGITYGLIAGQLLAGLVRGEVHPWQQAYAPGRLRLKRLGRAIERVRQEAIASQGSSEASQVPRPGEGVVRWQDGVPLACHMDAAGAVVVRSAVCPHLGCILAWNTVESGWECACHGSSYSPSGAVRGGPSTRAMRAPRRSSAVVAAVKTPRAEEARVP